HGGVARFCGGAGHQQRAARGVRLVHGAALRAGVRHHRRDRDRARPWRGRAGAARPLRRRACGHPHRPLNPSPLAPKPLPPCATQTPPMKLSRLYRPHDRRFWLMIVLNVLSAILAWVLRTYPLVPLASVVVGVFALGNAALGMFIM